MSLNWCEENYSGHKQTVNDGHEKNNYFEFLNIKGCFFSFDYRHIHAMHAVTSNSMLLHQIQHWHDFILRQGLHKD